jgi:hypothetical protein
MVQAIHDDQEYAGRSHAVTTGDGAYRLFVTEHTSYDIVVGSDEVGFAFLTHVDAGSDNATLSLRPGGIIRVHARTSNGKPAEGLSVQGPVGINGARFLELSGTETDADGVAELDVPAGVIDVVIRDEAGHTLKTVQATVREGKTADTIVVLDGKLPGGP